MKNSLKYIFSNLLLVGLTGTMFLAAGCPADEDTCETNEDCTVEGEVCNSETNVCEAESNGCMDDSECTTDGEYCLGEAGSQTCRQPSDCSELTDATAYCANILGADFDATTQVAVCNAEKMCEAKAVKEYRYIQVVDQSSGDGSCASTSAGTPDAGSDIVTIALLDETGSTIGFAKTKAFSAGTGEAGFADATTVFDGTARDQTFYDENGVCPAPTAGTMDRFREDSVVSLGCTGELIVEFLDANGESIAIDPAKHQVEVTEFGPYCSDQADPSDPDANFGADKFATYICTTNAGGDVASSDCATLLGTDADAGYEIYNLSEVSELPVDPNVE